MTHEEIVSKYFNSDHLGLQHPYKERALKAMAEAVEVAQIEWMNEDIFQVKKFTYLEALLAKKDKEITELKKKGDNIFHNYLELEAECNEQKRQIADLKEEVFAYKQADDLRDGLIAPFSPFKK